MSHVLHVRGVTAKNDHPSHVSTSPREPRAPREIPRMGVEPNLLAFCPSAFEAITLRSNKNMALDARGVARDKEFECFDLA